MQRQTKSRSGRVAPPLVRFDDSHIIGPLKNVGFELSGTPVTNGCFLQQPVSLENHAQPATCGSVPRVAARVRINLPNLLSDAGREIVKGEMRQPWDRGIPLGSQTGESECKHLKEDQVQRLPYHFFLIYAAATTYTYTLALHDALPVGASLRHA